MENKYYTPEISEFYLGFEYELLGSSGKMIPGGITQKWEILEYSLDASYLNDEDDLKELLDCGEIRVKYLDSSDIEELGFTYKGKTIDVWFEKEGNFDMGTWTSYKCQLHYGLHDNRLFIDMIDMGDEVRVFNGIVKNKSELKKVLNMLNIK
jgi:hypothetical protein